MSKSVWQTGISVANSMIGSSLIIFPITFLTYGVIESAIFVLIMSSLMTLTCALFVRNILPNEEEVSQSIRRILGVKFFYAFSTISAFTAYLVSSVFFLLASGLFYDVLEIFIDDLKDSFGEKWFKIIFLALFSVTCFLKNLKGIFTLAPFALAALLISTGILIGSMPLNMDNLDSDYFSFKEFTFENLLNLASLCGFAFICHPTISPIIKANKDQKSNIKAVCFGYGIATSFYLLVGIGGSMAIYGLHPTKAEYVMDFFQGKFQSPTIGILNIIYLLLIIPIFPFVVKSQLLYIMPEKIQRRERIGLEMSCAFAFMWIGLNVMLVLTETSPGVVIGFIGAVMAYFITYVLPILMTCAVGSKINKILLDQLSDSSLILPEKDQREPLVAAKGFSLTSLRQNSLAVLVGSFAILLYGAILMGGELYSLFSAL